MPANNKISLRFYGRSLLVAFYILKRNKEIPNAETHFQQISAKSSSDGVTAEKLIGLLKNV